MIPLRQTECRNGSICAVSAPYGTPAKTTALRQRQSFDDTITILKRRMPVFEGNCQY